MNILLDDRKVGPFWYRRALVAYDEVHGAGITARGRVTAGVVLFPREIHLRLKIFPRRLLRGRVHADKVPTVLHLGYAFGLPPEPPNFRSVEGGGRIGLLFWGLSWQAQEHCSAGSVGGLAASR